MRKSLRLTPVDTANFCDVVRCHLQSFGMTHMNKLAYTIDEAAAAGPIGKTKIFEVIKTGALPARKLGGRTFILVDDFRVFLEGAPVVQRRQAA